MNISGLTNGMAGLETLAFRKWQYKTALPVAELPLKGINCCSLNALRFSHLAICSRRCTEQLLLVMLHHEYVNTVPVILHLWQSGVNLFSFHSFPSCANRILFRSAVFRARYEYCCLQRCDAPLCGKYVPIWLCSFTSLHTVIFRIFVHLSV
jgi:hypothetical protein